MNPTSSGIQSPGYTLSTNSSPSSETPKPDHGYSLDKSGWHTTEGCFFPVYSKLENEQFKKTFDQCVKKVSLKLKAMMACLLEVSPKTITTTWKAFSTLVSCLGDDLPQQIPLSIFTSAVATECIANIEDSPPTKKSKSSDSLEEATIRNKTLTSAQELANAISSTLSFLQTGVQLNKLKEKNQETHQTCRAFQHVVTQRLSVECFADLDNADCDLAERIVSAIAPQRDRCSSEARDQLLISATKEFVSTQEALIRDTYLGLAFQKKTLPITGKGVLAICIQHSTNSITVSETIEWLPSWQKLSFYYLARSFLQKNYVVIPHQANYQLLLDELKRYFPISDILSSSEMKQYLTKALACDFVHSHSLPADRRNPQPFDLTIRYNEFLQSSTSITSLLKGLFILDNGMNFSISTLSTFQKYTQTLYLPNTTATINNAIQESAIICAEEHQKIFSCTRSLLGKTNSLLQHFIFQSLAIAVARKQRVPDTPSKEVVPCEWMPDELRSSLLCYNYWEEAIWAHHSDVLFSPTLPRDVKELAKLIKTTSAQLQTTFQRLCYNLIVDVLAEMPLECSENVLEVFSATAQVFQAKMMPKYAPASSLFTIAINFIVKSEKFTLCNTLLTLARQDFQEAQQAFVAYVYSFLLENKDPLPSTQEALLACSKKQYKGTMHAPKNLEQLPFWKDCIFVCLANMFLQKKQKPIPFLKEVKTAVKSVEKHFSKSIGKKVSTCNKRDFFTKILAETLLSMHSEPINLSKQTTSTQGIYEAAAYENFLHSVISLNNLIKSFFKLDTGKNLSPKNLIAFHKYTNTSLLHTGNSYPQAMVLGSFTMYIIERQLLDESKKKTRYNLAKIPVLLKKLLKEAATILILRKQTYKYLSPQAAVTAAFRLIHSDACVPDILLLSTESWTFWEKTIQTIPKVELLSQIPNHFERTSKMYSETATELTHCFLKLCHKLFVEISGELMLQSVTEQFPQNQEQQFIETASLSYLRIILDPHQKQFVFKELVAFLAKDKFQTNNIQTLTLATKNFLKTQQNFVQRTYTYLIQHKLPLPRTGKELLASFKNQYRSTTVIALSLAKLPSWNNLIFYSLAHIFLLGQRKKIALDSRPWNIQSLINNIAPFFPNAAKETATLSIEARLDRFTKCLTEYFRSSMLLTHDTENQRIEIDPYTCRAYESLLQSTDLLKTFFRTLFKLETGNDCFLQHLQAFQAYIEKLFVNEPNLQKINVLQDISIICSDENHLPEGDLNQLWQNLTYANLLLKIFMELSLALVIVSEKFNNKLTPQQVVADALQITSSITCLPLDLAALPTAFIISSAGTNALQEAMKASASGNLCLKIFEQPSTLLQKSGTNPLQMAIDARISGQSSPQIAEHTHLLVFVFLSMKEALTSIYKKLYLDLKTNVMAAISKETYTETPSQKFTKTANTYHAKMISEQHAAVPLFQSLVFMLAQRYEDELQKQPQDIFDISIETELNANTWQSIIDSLLTEDTVTIVEQDSQISYTQETEEQLTGSMATSESSLFADDFTDLLLQTENFANFLEEEL